MVAATVSAGVQKSMQMGAQAASSHYIPRITASRTIFSIAAASKAATLSLCSSLYCELRAEDIDVVAIEASTGLFSPKLSRRESQLGASKLKELKRHGAICICICICGFWHENENLHLHNPAGAYRL